ncbi:hypothetical protein [Ramlibacter sp. WS9]|uniref:hypothetical protein n=1 Tax=Ramlibacter sp. WS9 TaxID=1882741 RepID=UPI001141B805|nr:hypothetical protein [Ramlibacter sp. WS9]ROZ74949.1 hypothetical protein EEB15_16330 [Ramlibacter sp. WS9]
MLGSSVIELKILEDEGLDKPERQAKVATLFRSQFPDRPTIVLDRSLLTADGQRTYDRIVEGPVKAAVGSARKQLEQSRAEHDVTTTVLWIVNNGYTSLNHSALIDLVTRRARNDSSEIDAVIVSGGYIYSDTFDSYFLWPIDYVPIWVDRPFREFEALREAWHAFVMERMNSVVREVPTAADTKGPVVDVAFRLDGVAYVMPTPPMGNESKFFLNGRPRRNSTGIDSCPRVATTFASLSLHEWSEFHRHEPRLISGTSHNDWLRKENDARQESQLKPFVALPVTYAGWQVWATRQPAGAIVSVHHYATDLFQEAILAVIGAARERAAGSVLPRRYLLLVTEEIGQDRAYDVSHLAEFCTLPDGTDRVDELWTNRSMFFEHALAAAAAAAEAVARGFDLIYWEKDPTYAWR